MFVIQKIDALHIYEYEKSADYVFRKALYPYVFYYNDACFYCASLLSYAEVCEHINKLHQRTTNKSEIEKWNNDWDKFIKIINTERITDKNKMFNIAKESTAVFKFLTVNVAKEILCSRWDQFLNDDAYNNPRNINYVKGEFSEKGEYIDKKYYIKVFANPEHLDFLGFGFDEYRKATKLSIYLQLDFKCVNSNDETKKYYMLEDLNADDVRTFKNLLSDHGLIVTYGLMNESETVYEPAPNEPRVQAKYRCAYCGKLFEEHNITVDHIYPVAKMVSSEDVRNDAAKHGIMETNDLNNLVAACKSCNEKKSDKMGLWILRGLFGRKESNWRILYGTIAAIIAIIAAVFIKTVIWPIIAPIITGEYGLAIVFAIVFFVSFGIAWKNKENLQYI